MLLGEPNGNTICCICCVLGMFTTQRTLLTFIISVQRKNTDGKNKHFISLLVVICACVSVGLSLI